MSQNKTGIDALEKKLKLRGIVIPIIFAIVVVIACIIMTNPHLGFFPSGNHHDSLTTTAPTETTEFDEDEYSRVIQD